MLRIQANYTLIDYENITDSRGLKNYWIQIIGYKLDTNWIQIVTDYLFQVLVSPISIDVYKGGIQDYIMISRLDSCKGRIINRFSETAKI